jgi:hypothetical protein
LRREWRMSPGSARKERDFHKGEELYKGGGPDLEPDKTGGTGERKAGQELPSPPDNLVGFRNSGSFVTGQAVGIDVGCWPAPLAARAIRPPRDKAPR